MLELPFSNLIGSKLRPVLVISSSKYNEFGNDIMVAKITGSKFNTSWETKLTNKDLKSGKLKKISFIDSGFILTIEKSIIKKSIANINEMLLENVLKKISKIVNIG